MVLSKDKKFAICFGLIIGALISISNLCFANTETEIDFVDVPGVAYNLSTMEFISSSGSSKVFSVEPGATYRIYNNAGSVRHFAYSSEFPSVGVSILDTFDIDGGGTEGRSDYITVPDNVNYIFLTTAFNNQNTWLYRVDGGLNGFVDQLVQSIGTEGLWSTFLACVPLLVLAVLWGLGFFLIVRLIVGIVKARGGV